MTLRRRGFLFAAAAAAAPLGLSSLAQAAPPKALKKTPAKKRKPSSRKSGGVKPTATIRGTKGQLVPLREGGIDPRAPQLSGDQADLAKKFIIHEVAPKTVTITPRQLYTDKVWGVAFNATLVHSRFNLAEFEDDGRFTVYYPTGGLHRTNLANTIRGDFPPGMMMTIFFLQLDGNGSVVAGPVWGVYKFEEGGDSLSISLGTGLLAAGHRLRIDLWHPQDKKFTVRQWWLRR